MLVLTLIINILLLIAWEAPTTDDGEPDNAQRLPDLAFDWFDLSLKIVGISQIVITACVVLTFFITNPPSVHLTLLSVPGLNRIKRYVDWVGEPADDRTHTSLFSVASVYHVALLALAIAGVNFSGYFFSFHLLHIVVGNDILLRAVRAVTKNGDSLLWVAALMVVVIYIYSQVIFAFLRGDANGAEHMWCNTPWQVRSLVAGWGATPRAKERVAYLRVAYFSV